MRDAPPAPPNAVASAEWQYTIADTDPPGDLLTALADLLVALRDDWHRRHDTPPLPLATAASMTHSTEDAA
jgi:hypothetical protein